MRLLMIYANLFSYEPEIQSLEIGDEKAKPASYKNAVVGFIHVEAHDKENAANVETKLVKNLKWAARKNNTRTIVLHSFAHLSESKADPEFTKQLFDQVEERLRKSDYETYQTPFGYFLNLNVRAPGHSFARLFKEF